MSASPTPGSAVPAVRVSAARRLPTRWWLSVFIVALLMRGGWGTFRFLQDADPAALEFPDEQQYWRMACSLWAGEGLKDELGFRATRMPLYPAVLSLFAGMTHGVVIAKVFNWVAGAAVAALTAGMATALFDRRVGLVAGLLAAFDPFLVFFSSLLLTETVFMAVLMGLWWITWRAMHNGHARGSWGERSDGNSLPHRASATRAAVIPEARPVPRARWIAIGLLAAACVYIRESSLGLIALALGSLVVFRRFDRSSLAGAAITLCIVLGSLYPWAARNRQVIGDWCWLTTRGGISLYDGVGSGASGASDLGSIKQMPAVAGLSEVEWNRYFLRQSWKAIRADSARILRLAGTKLARMWNPFPNVDQYQSPLVRCVSVAWTVPIFTLAAVGALLLPIRNKADGWRTAFFLLLPALYLTLLHSLFVGSVRYRLPAMPMIEILAAVALLAVVKRITDYRLRTKKRTMLVAGNS